MGSSSSVRWLLPVFMLCGVLASEMSAAAQIARPPLFETVSSNPCCWSMASMTTVVLIGCAHPEHFAHPLSTSPFGCATCSGVTQVVAGAIMIAALLLAGPSCGCRLPHSQQQHHQCWGVIALSSAHTSLPYPSVNFVQPPYEPDLQSCEAAQSLPIVYW